jgi:hypothetical protein
MCHEIELRNFHNMQKQQSSYSWDYFPVVLCIGTTNLTVCQYDGFSTQSTFIVRWLGTLSPIITFFDADSERNLYGGGGRNSGRIYQFGKKQIIEALQVHEPDRNPG